MSEGGREPFSCGKKVPFPPSGSPHPSKNRSFDFFRAGKRKGCFACKRPPVLREKGKISAVSRCGKQRCVMVRGVVCLVNADAKAFYL